MTATDANLAFGLMFPEDFEFPWDTDEFDLDFGVWWGKNGAGAPPVELINYCSGGDPAYILAIPASRIQARRGYPVRLGDTLAEHDGDHWRWANWVKALIAFCRRWNIDTGGQAPAWWLSSYWEGE